MSDKPGFSGTLEEIKALFYAEMQAEIVRLTAENTGLYVQIAENFAAHTRKLGKANKDRRRKRRALKEVRALAVLMGEGRDCADSKMLIEICYDGGVRARR